MDDTPRRPRRPDDEDDRLRRPRPDSDDRPRRRPEPREEVERLEEVADDSYGVKREEVARPPREWDAAAPKDAPLSRRRREDDEDDDRPRSRRRRNEDEEDDRSRSRRQRDEEEEEDNRPRRKKRPTPTIAQMDVRVKVLLWGGALALVLLVLGVWWLVRTVKRAPFQPAMALYLAGPAGMAPPGTPVRKLVVVDVKDRDIDGLHFDLPGDIRAANPAEVTTVAQLMWDKRQVGTYSTGGGAYQWVCDVILIDLKTRGQIGRQQFTGSPPPQSFHGRRGESRTGDKPTDAVLGFLRGQRR